MMSTRIVLVWLITQFLVCSGSEEVNIEPGENVTLQCQSSRDADIILKWIRPDLKSEGYVYYFKPGHLNEDMQPETFHGRVELKDPEMKDGDMSVILKNVTINDTGTYECVVGINGSNGRKPELINTINLTVEPSGHDNQGDKTGGNTAALIVVVVLVLLSVSGFFFVGYKWYKNHKGPRDQDSYQQPSEQRPELY